MNTPQSTPLYCSILGNPPEPVNTFETQDRPELPYKNISEWIEYGHSPVDKSSKKNKPIGKPIDKYDRLNALIRMPVVQKEALAIEKESNEKEKVELQLIFLEKYKELPGLLKHPEVFNKYKHSFDLNTIHVFNNFEKSDLDSISKYRDGKHIIIAVDMSKKRKDIMREFGKVLARISKDYKIPKDNTRDKETVQDIWKIYDYHKKDKLNFVQIARKISGRKGNPSYDPKLESYVKQVRTAYKKAVDIIEQVRKEIRKKDE